MTVHPVQVTRLKGHDEITRKGKAKIITAYAFEVRRADGMKAVHVKISEVDAIQHQLRHSITELERAARDVARVRGGRQLDTSADTAEKAPDIS